MEENEIAKLERRLDALIALMLKDKKWTIGEKVVLLKNLGLANLEIAKILDISQKHVSKEFSISKRGKVND